MPTWGGQGKKGKKRQGSSLQIQMFKLTELCLQSGHAVSTWLISANESKNIQDTTLCLDNRNLFALNMLVGIFLQFWIQIIHLFKTDRHIRERRQAIETVKRTVSQISGRTAEISGRELEETTCGNYGNETVMDSVWFQFLKRESRERTSPVSSWRTSDFWRFIEKC